MAKIFVSTNCQSPVLSLHLSQKCRKCIQNTATLPAAAPAPSSQEVPGACAAAPESWGRPEDG